MKKNIHPKYYKEVMVRCACGNIFAVNSVKEFIETEVCFLCHSFYTGKSRVIDSLGRVEKFKKRLSKKTVATVKKKRVKKK